MVLVHASCIALAGEGVLLRGAPGAGKSDLTLRLIEGGARLVADDQVVLTSSGEALLAAPPSRIAGLLEVRGIGIVSMEFVQQCPVHLVVDLVKPDAVERMPEGCGRQPLRSSDRAGCTCPVRGVRAGEGSARALARCCRRPAGAGRTHGRLMGTEPSGDRTLVLVTGMSGAGKSTALRILEDLGYEAIDNLPLSLLSELVQARGENGQRGALALGIDSRTRGFDPGEIERHLEPLLGTDQPSEIALLFLDCETEVLRRRFSETRRPHPLAHDQPVVEGIAREARTARLGP